MSSAWNWDGAVVAFPGVYAPQHDSHLLMLSLAKAGLSAGARVLDLCTGTGIVALAAASAGAAEVTALDIDGAAVDCARANAEAAALDIDVVQGGIAEAKARGPFDVVLCNPPYVPSGLGIDSAGPIAGAWDAGPDGRLVLEPLCAEIGTLLTPRGCALIVHSEFSGIEVSIRQLKNSGLAASVVQRRRIPFGPVLSSRARWLEMRGLLELGRREEEIVVIRADRNHRSDG
ncbi:MAG: HemK2/MTQ2 family protein methyltransferase [Rhodococcus sp. (in: high G+C Gram-positive bacteria)]